MRIRVSSALLALLLCPAIPNHDALAFDPFIETRVSDAIAAGQSESAIQLIKQEIDKSNDARFVEELQLRLAEVYGAAGQYQEAGQAHLDHVATSALRVGQSAPELARYYARAADAFLKAGDITAAIESFASALGIAHQTGQEDTARQLIEQLRALSAALGENEDGKRAASLADEFENKPKAIEPAGKSRKFVQDPSGEFSKVTVYFATDRAKTGRSEPAEVYGFERGELSYGRAEVTVPRQHKPGNIEEPSIWSLEVTENPERHMVLRALYPRTKRDILSDMRKHLKTADSDEAFIFVHGYNVTFTAAAKRAAQLAYDMNFDGLPIMYSWPSRGSMLSYIADTAVVRLSGRRLLGFLESIIRDSGARRIHIIAHSMGNRAVTDALELLSLRRAGKSPAFDQVVFAAPDLDGGLFADMVERIRPIARRMTLYGSENDWALKASRKVHGNQRRAGQGGSEIVRNTAIDSVDMSDLGEDMLAHSYFADDASALTDILSLFWRDDSPKRRCGMREQEVDPPIYWQFQPDECDGNALLSALAILRGSNSVSLENAIANIPKTKSSAEAVRIKGALRALLAP